MTSSDSRKKRPSFSLKTLAWTTFAAACLFLGWQWGSYNRDDARHDKATQLVIGESIEFDAVEPIPRFQVDDESVCTVKPISVSQFEVTAVGPGDAIIKFWNHAGQTQYLPVVVK